MTLPIGNVRPLNRAGRASGTVPGPGMIVPHVQILRDREVLMNGEELLASDGSGLRLIEGVAHVLSATPANVEIDDVFTLLLGGVAVATYIAVAATVKDVVEGLQLAWEAGKAAVPGAEDITATEDDLKVTLTADRIGVPFVVTATAVDGGGADTQTLTMAIVADNDTSNVVATAEHVLGISSIEFDKIDGTVNSVRAGFYIILDEAIDLSRFCGKDEIEAAFLIPDLTDVDTVELRLGTDDSNYSEWWMEDGIITQAIWQIFEAKLSEVQTTVVGNGCDLGAVKYIAFVVEFDAAADTLADMFLNYIMVRSAD